MILLVSDGILHPPLLGRLALERFLRSLDRFHTQRVSSMEGLLPLNLSAYSALVLYFHHRSISPAALSAFEHYVRDGGGVLAVHSVTASFRGSPRYFEILGGRFIRHGPVEPMTLLPITTENSPFQGLSAFTATDELYRHEFDEDNSVHFAVDMDGELLPQVWTRAYGRGRVCCFAPGHTTATMRLPVVHKILRRGLDWVAG